MKKTLLGLLVLAAWARADTGYSNTIRLKETDNSPACTVGEINVSPGSLTCAGGKGTITTGGGGGGGSSSLETLVNGVQISSPTGTLNFKNGTGISISGTVPASSTAAITINLRPDSTNYIQNRDTLQSGATFYVSSGTVGVATINTSLTMVAGSTLAATSGNLFINSVPQINAAQLYINQPNTGIVESDLYLGQQAGTQGSIKKLFYASSGSKWDSPMILNAGGSNNLMVDRVGGISVGALGLQTQTTFYVNGNVLIGSGYADTGGSPAPVDGLYVKGSEIVASSLSVQGASGLGVTYGAIVGSMTVSNLTSGQCVQAGTGGLLTVSGSACGSGGGGSSSLAVTTGTATGWTSVASSPTAVLNFDNTIFSATLKGGSTNFVSILPTLYLTQSSATATYGQLAANQTWTGQQIWSNPQPSTFTYAVALASIVFTGGTNPTFNKPGESIDYQFVGSSTTPTAGQLPIWSSTMAIVATPLRSTILAVDASGILISTTVTGGSGTPGGGNYNVQIASAGAFAGITNFNVYPSSIVVGNQFATYTSTLNVSGGSFTVTGISTVTINASASFQSLIQSTQSFVIKDVSGNPTFWIDNTNPGANASNFSTVASTAATYELTASTAIAGPFHLDVSTTGHINSQGTAPAISSCGSTPNGSVVGTDVAGTISVGGGTVTACTLTFATSWKAAPNCVITDNSTAVTGDLSSLTNTAFTASFSLSIGSGKIYYICIGND